MTSFHPERLTSHARSVDGQAEQGEQGQTGTLKKNSFSKSSTSILARSEPGEKVLAEIM